MTSNPRRARRGASAGREFGSRWNLGSGRLQHLCSALVVTLCVASLPTAATAVLRIDVPDVRGDQLIFYYDARDGRASFLTVNNPAQSGSVVVEVAFYSTDLASVVGSDQIEIPAAGTTIIDPSSLDGVAGNRGLAVVTPIDTEGKAIVPPVPLTGTFTLANLKNAAFGENAMGRRAVLDDGTRAAAGKRVDNTGDAPVRYQQFAPTILTIPGYFDPRDLAPAADDGNRVIVAAFKDVYGDLFRIAARDPALRVTVHLCDGSSGTVLVETELKVDDVAGVNGVAVTDLQALAGGVALDSAGSVYFSPEPLGSNNFFGIFSQSLGTFGAGQRMPSASTTPWL